jgi:uncharacterized protein (TIGR02453 family)
MGFTRFDDEAFEFYEGLRADNSKTYWTEHKHVYDRSVRAPMQALLDELSERFGGEPTLFRPYRDVRFSADKSPYKTGQGGYLKLATGLGYWMQLNADGVMVGGGCFTQDRAQVQRMRSAIDEDLSGKALSALVDRLKRAGFDLGGRTVKTRPRGVPADHPRLELMRHESLTVHRMLPMEPVTTAMVAADWKRITPLIDWMTRYSPPAG